MIRSRHQRRAMKRNAAANAAMLARCCFDYDGAAMLPVTDPLAIATLERAFTRMLQAGGEPMAVPLSEAEAKAFPFHEGEKRLLPGGVTWMPWVSMYLAGAPTPCSAPKTIAGRLPMKPQEHWLCRGSGYRWTCTAFLHGRRCRPMLEAASNEALGTVLNMPGRKDRHPSCVQFYSSNSVLYHRPTFSPVSFYSTRVLTVE